MFKRFTQWVSKFPFAGKLAIRPMYRRFIKTKRDEGKGGALLNISLLLGFLVFLVLQFRRIFGRIKQPTQLLGDVADGGSNLFMGFIPIWVCGGFFAFSVVLNIIDYIKM